MKKLQNINQEKMKFTPGKELVAIITISIIVCLLAGSPAIAERNQPPDQWSPESAVRFALKNNPDTAIIKQRIAAAQASVKEANAAFYPRFDLNASYQQTNTPMYSFGNILNQGEFNQGIDFNDPGTTDALTLQAVLSYRMYNGGRDQAGLKVAMANKQASMQEENAIRSQLAFEVVKTFFTIVQAEETLQARESALESIQASLHVARARHEAGDLLKADLLNLEVHLSEARENLIQARHGANLAKRAFLNLLGLEQGTFQIKPNCNIEQLIPTDYSFVNRPELKRIRASIEAGEARLRRAQGGYYPTADAFAQYQYDKGFELDGNGDSWMAGVKVNLNLFAGRQTEAQVAAARAMLAQQKEFERKVSLQINLEVEKARLGLEQAQQRFLVTEKMVEQAEESASLNRERFKEGVILSSELIDVENRLIDAQVRRTLARAETRIAVADLRRAVGLDQFNSGFAKNSTITP